MSGHTRTYYAVRSAVRAVFWLGVAALPFIAAGMINALTCAPVNTW